MRLKVFIGTGLSALVATLTSPTFAQTDRPTDGPTSPNGSAPGEQPAAPPSSETTPTEALPKDPSPPPAAERGAGEAAVTGNAAAAPGGSADVGGGGEMPDTGPAKIGSTLSPLIVSAGVGYAYAAVTHPDLVSHSLSGAFLEVTAGTELDERFRLSLSFTSFETKLRRTRSGLWEEGDYTGRTASGLHALADPVTPNEPQAGGVVVQKSFHAHSLGPRMDFLPLGSQGPYSA